MENATSIAKPVLSLAQWFRHYRLSVLLYATVIGLVYHQIIWSMGVSWSNDANYSHGFLVPLVSGYFLWSQRERIWQCEVNPSIFGLGIVMLGVVQLLFAFLASELFTLRASMIVITAGAIIYALGWVPFKAMMLPILYLFIMIPIPTIIYDSITLPMKMLVAKISVTGLAAFGYSVVREGNIIMLPNITLEVADACSGLRSLMSLLALSIAFAFLSQKNTWKRWVLILSAFPIAIFTNILRVFFTGILAKYYGRVAAEGFFHEFAGMMVFVVAMLLLLALGSVMRAGAGKDEL